MTPLAKFVTNAIEQIFFCTAMIAEATALTGHFREVVLAGESLKEAVWAPGQSVHFHLGSLKMRTYTPMAWDKSPVPFVFCPFCMAPGQIRNRQQT